MYNSKSMMMHMCMADGMMVMCRMFMCVQFSGFEGLVGTTELTLQRTYPRLTYRKVFCLSSEMSAVGL